MKIAIVIGNFSRSALSHGCVLSNKEAEFLDSIVGKNDAEVFTSNMESKPSMAEIRQHRERLLIPQINKYKPDFIVALGTNAAKSLWNKGSGISVINLRRVEHDLPDIPAPVIVTYSLADASVNPHLYNWIKRDILETTASEQSEIDYTVSAEPMTLQEPIALDLETYPSFDPWHPEARIRMAIIAGKDWTRVVPFGESGKCPNWLRKVIEDETIEKRGSGIARFDAVWLRRFGITARNLRDTAVAEHTLDENLQSKSLKTLTLTYVPELGDYSLPFHQTVEKYGGWDKVPDEEFYDYGAKDGYASYHIHAKQIPLLEQKGLMKPFRLLSELGMVLAEIEHNGICISLEKNRALKELYEPKLSELRYKIRDELGIMNPNSPKQIIEVLKQEIPGINLFYKGGESSDKNVLVREAKRFPILNTLMEYKRYSKLYSTYVKSIGDKAVQHGDYHVIHAGYRNDTTVTYRSSSSNPNMQNIPRNFNAAYDIKQQFVSRFPNGSLIEVDLSQAELREGAMVTGDRRMQEILSSGGDIHTQVSQLLLGKKEITKQERQAGKTLNFGLYYGLGVMRLSSSLGCSLSRAETLSAKYKSIFPATMAWVERQKAHVRENLWVKSRFGFYRRFAEPPSWDSGFGKSIEREAVNAVIQNGGFMQTACALIDLAQALQQMKLQAVIAGTVHDQALVDAPEDEVETVQQLMGHIFSNPRVERWGVINTVPMIADVSCGENWSEMKDVFSKKGKVNANQCS